MGASLRHTVSVHPPRIVEPISKVLDTLIRTIFAPRIDTGDSSNFRQVAKKKSNKKANRDDHGAGGGEDKGGEGSNNADGGAGDGGTGDGAGDGGAGDGGEGEGGGGDDGDHWGPGDGRSKKKGKKGKNNKNDDEEKTGKEEKNDDEEKEENHGDEKKEEKGEIETPWDDAFSPLQKKKRGKGKVAAVENKSKKNDDEKNDDCLVKDDDTKQEDEKDEKVETEPYDDPLATAGKKSKKGKKVKVVDQWMDQGLNEAVDNERGMGGRKQETEKDGKQKEESQEPVSSWDDGSWSASKKKKGKSKKFGYETIDEDEATKKNETESTTNEDNWLAGKDENQMLNASESLSAEASENAGLSNSKKKKSKKVKLNSVEEEVPEKKDGQQAPEQEEADIMGNEEENKDATTEWGLTPPHKKKKNKKSKMALAENEGPPERDDNLEEVEKIEKAEDDLNAGHWDSPTIRKKVNKKAKSSILEEEVRKNIDGEEKVANEDTEAIGDTFDQRPKADTKKKPNKKGKPNMNEEDTQSKDAEEEGKEDTWTTGNGFELWTKNDTKKITNKKGKPIVNVEETQKKDTEEKEAKNETWDGWPKNDRDDGKRKTNKKGKLDVDEDEQKNRKDDKDGIKNAVSWDHDGDDWEGLKSTDKKDTKSKVRGSHSRIHHILWLTSLQAGSLDDLENSPGPMYGVSLESMDLGLGESQNLDLQFDNQFGNWGKNWDTDIPGRGDMNKLGSTQTTSAWTFGAISENPEETSTSFGVAKSWGTDNFLTSGTQEKPAKAQSRFDFACDNKSKEVEHGTIAEESLENTSWRVKPLIQKKNKKGDVEPSPLPTASMPEDPSIHASKKKKPKKNSKGAEPSIQEEVPKLDFTVDDSWGGHSKPKESKKAKNGTKSEAEKANDPGSNIDNFSVGGLGDNEYGDFGVAKKDKESPKDFDKFDDWTDPTATEPKPGKVSKKDKKKKKEATFGLDDQVTISSELEPKNESETKLEKDEFVWGLQNDKKTSKFASTESDKFNFLNFESVGVEVPQFGKPDKKKGNKTDLDTASQGDSLDFFDTTKPVAEFDGFSSTWITGIEKTQKGTSDVNGSEAAIPATKESTEVTFTATTELQAKKERSKKGKKSKAAVDNTVVIPETVMEKIADLEESTWDDWGSRSQGKDKNEPDEQEKEDKKTKSGKKGKSKTKELLAGSTPDDVSIEPESWAPWGDTKKSLISAPPPAPTPPRQGLSPEPTTSSISGLNGTADDYWATSTIYQPPSSKSKKDVKKADNSKWAAKGWNDQTEEFNEESLKNSPKEETLADTTGSFWGFGSKTTKSKASREKEKGEAAKKEEEEANLIDLQDSTNASLGGWKLDPIDDSAVTKSSKSKETNVSKATSKNSKESDKASKISDNYKSWNTDRIDESVVTKGSKSKESNVSKATSKKSKENSENYGYKAWDNNAVEESVVTKGSKSKDSNVSRPAGKNSKENDKDKKKKTSAKADAEEFLAEPVEPVEPVSPVIFDETNDGYNLASEEASKGDGDNNDDVQVDAWSFWGGTKKKTGTNKKDDGPKKEIAKLAIAEPAETLKDWSNAPEPSFLDDKPEPEKNSDIKTSKKAMSKLTGKSAVLQRVKALEATRAEKEKEEREKPFNTLSSSVVESFEPLDKVELPPKKVGKSKATSGNKGAASKKKDLSPPPDQEKQASKDPIPGSFPAEALDDDLFIDVLDPPVKENKSKESSKLSKLSKASKELPKYKEEPAEVREADILIDVVETPSKKKSYKDSSKLSKANKKSPKSKKEPKMEDLIDFDTPTPPELPDLQDEAEEQDEADEQEESEAPEVPEVPEAPTAPESPPTPPPEPVSAKPAKKERAKVVRDEGASWAFWGASPRKPAKKELKAKDDAVSSPAGKERSPPIGLTRSKSTKTAKEKETEKTSAKSSGSDKDKKPEPRIPRARPSGFGGFFGGLPPPRAKPVRKPSAATPKNFSRRESIEVDAIGIPSPPAEEAPEMNNKAARLMGTTASKLERKDSIRAKPKGRRQYLPPTSTELEQGADYANIVVPDPYPIDDDDMILVNDLEDPVINPAISKPKDIRRERSTNNRAKKEVRPDPNTPAGSSKISPEADIAKKNGQVNQSTEPTDDTIMLETGPSSDGAELPSLQEALAFDEKPRSSPVVRGLTNTRKSDSKLMGLFGGFRKPRRASEMYERPRKAPIDGFDANLRRKRGVTGDGDAPKRIRHEDRKVRRAEKTDGEDDGFITEAPIAAESPAPETHEFGRDEQRPKRSSRSQPSKERKRSRLTDVEDQRLKRQEADQAEDKLRRAKARERRERKELEEAENRRAERRAKRAARDERSKDGPNSREGDEVDIRREDKRLKRTAREGRPIKEEPQFRDFDPIPTPERQNKRREKDLLDRDKRRESSSRQRKSDRRRLNIRSPRSPGTRPTLERHRSSRRTPGEKDKSSSRRRSSAQPPVDSYFDSRNGAGGEPTPNDTIPPLLDPLQQDLPYIHSGGNDHTSSWVKSQISEPPPPPPVEPSVLDPPPILGPSGLGGDDSAGEEARRALRRKSRKQSRAYGEPDPEVETPRRRRRESSRKGIKSSEGSAEQERDRWRRKSEYGAVMSPVSGRSPMLGSGLGGGAKKGSWFQKFKDMADGR